MDTVVGTDPAVRETARLISSDKVEGTAVRNASGDKVGTIERVMIDKRAGKVAYAVMSFGGFLGMGQDYVALPWHMLRYNENLDAYEMNITENQLRGAPAIAQGWDTGIVNRDWERKVHTYYGVDPYW
jgi:PRC-barrel domain